MIRVFPESVCAVANQCAIGPIHSQRVVAVQARLTRNCSHVWSHWPIGHRYQWEEWRNFVQHRLAQSNYLDS
jgi:hypothetical protein